ncbi:DoxX family protein [Oryzisolibacter sp. LB2S]|uniref:DoxX family protein n=1 Tax=Alicycliphilus soli TaxID=3228789 RepID=UPI00345B3BF0
MSAALQNALILLGRILIAPLFVPSGIGKITDFAGTVGYATAMGLPLPTVGIAIAIVIELLGSLALVLGFGARIAALALAVFSLTAAYFLPCLLGCP